MNQDQIKEKLLLLATEAAPFTVVLSGKKSRKVNGLYRPQTRQIILHNRNFSSDPPLLYTAIHEFAHHLQFTTSALPISARVHTSQFREIFHSLLRKAESLGVYRSLFDSDPEFLALTDSIRKNILVVDGRLLKELGRLLAKAMELCEKREADYDDYLSRVLNLNRANASLAIKVHTLDLDPSVGAENLKALVRIRDAAKRREAETALRQGESAMEVGGSGYDLGGGLETPRPAGMPEGAGRPAGMPGVQHPAGMPEGAGEALAALKAEKLKCERQIERLTQKVRELERRIKKLRTQPSGPA